MKIIQAMKTIKANIAKIEDLTNKIRQHSAYTNIETPPYADTKATVRGWIQSIHDIGQENIRLQILIAKTNMATPVTIELGGVQVTKTIAEWVWRRRQYAEYDLAANMALTDRGIKEGSTKLPTGDLMEIKIVRNFDVEKRDADVALYRAEPSIIDSAMEVVNAVTDLIET